MSDHRNEEHEEEEVFLVTDEDGNEHEMVMVYTFESDEKAYAVLLERNNPEADGIIFRLEEENDEVYLVSIEDDEEWEKVASAYERIAAEESE